MPAAFTSPPRPKPSRLGQFVAGVNTADRIRRHMAKSGLTLAGQKLWSTGEIELLRRLYPDYRHACVVLSCRTRGAIGSKAVRLGIARPLRIWSDDDLNRLKVLYRRGRPMREIKAALPGKTAKQIWRRAAQSGWRRPRKPPKITGLKPYDDVRARAFARKITMRDLAYLSVTGDYFLRRPSRNDWKKIDKAVAVLEGRLSILWELQ